ncbi:hypothetical protein BaRGS_00015362 [Batillaria attramentaria]|uniref:MYND-type domain-containing protein n=1 Tax=Batillaria attramentaria TaxID=370345 RepID=A0ABD0L244_9CAEN
MADGAAACGLRDDRNVCQLCGALENLSLCGGCRDTWYCCKDHQRAHWKQHKRKCKGKQQPKKAQPPSSACEAAEDNASAKVTSEQTTATADVSPEPKDSTHSDCVCEDQNAAASEADGVAAVVKSATASDVNGDGGDCPQDQGTESGASLTFKTPHPPASSSPRKHTNTVKKQTQLPAIAEEGNGERYFLNASQTLQSSKHTARARRSASAMSPKGSTVDTKDAYLDVLRSRFAVYAEYVVKCLQTYGLCVIDGFLGEITGQEILAEVKQLQELGVFHKGQLVHSASTSTDNIRGDIITWVDGRGQLCENIQFLVSCMDAVVQNCSSLMDGYSINERTKAMVACYPGNSTGYVRHVDNPNGDGRCITCIYYLNQNWNIHTDGGMLRIYPEGKDTVANIEPIYAITVWYYEAEERARALKRFKGERSDHPKKQAVPLFNGSQTRNS